MKNIHNVAICSHGNTLSGGEKCAFEIIPRLAIKYPSVNYFCHRSLSEKSGGDYISRTINLFKTDRNPKSKIGVLALYFIIFLKSLRFVRKFSDTENVIISHSDAWPDVLFAFLLKLRNKNAYWVAINHMVHPSLWRGYKYANTRKIKMPTLIDIYNFLNQHFFFLLQKKANLLVSINANDKEYLSKRNKNVFIIRHGKEYAGEPNFDKNKKPYDICFLGRFYEEKGIDEIPDILSHLRKINTNKLSIIFIGQENNYSNWLKAELVSNNLDYNIEFLGPKFGEEKFNLLKKTKVMIFPSYFESFGIVYLDAISVGTPVVEYNLPCLTDHRYGVLKGQFRDNQAFARNVNDLLIDDNLYRKLSTGGYSYSKEFSWDKTAASILNKIHDNYHEGTF